VVKQSRKSVPHELLRRSASHDGAFFFVIAKPAGLKQSGT
jgi:hypothetical protein